MYAGDDNKAIGEEMAISAVTVRTHKFNIQKMKREARILLALLENIENEEVVTARRVLLEQMDRDRENEVPENANGLHLDPLDHRQQPSSVFYKFLSEMKRQAAK